MCAEFLLGNSSWIWKHTLKLQAKSGRYIAQAGQAYNKLLWPVARLPLQQLRPSLNQRNSRLKSLGNQPYINYAISVFLASQLWPASPQLSARMQIFLSVVKVFGKRHSQPLRMAAAATPLQFNALSVVDSPT